MGTGSKVSRILGARFNGRIAPGARARTHRAQLTGSSGIHREQGQSHTGRPIQVGSHREREPEHTGCNSQDPVEYTGSKVSRILGARSRSDRTGRNSQDPVEYTGSKVSRILAARSRSDRTGSESQNTPGVLQMLLLNRGGNAVRPIC